ncbi:hypothetical protein E5P71_06685 [Helicobacter pylori]|nr:hypothetical protein E5P71_06685 [Helicobacter pylori]
MKNHLDQSHIVKSITEVGYRQTEEIVKDYPDLKAENVELKRKCEKFESKNQKLIVENADQKRLIGALEQVNAIQQQLIESKNETIDALKRGSDIKDELLRFYTEERNRDEEKEYSKSCLGLE